MKKIFAIILGVLFVMSFAASAFAIHAEIPSETQAVVAGGATQITIGGELRTRGWYLKNISDAKAPVDTPSQAYYDERIRLSVDAKVAPNVQGFVQLESTNGKGEMNQDSYKWGNFNAKPSNVTILQAWILYTGSGLFGFNSGLKVGHMPLGLSHMEFFDHTHYGDDAVVFFMDPTKEMHIGLLAVKFAEASSAATGNGSDLDGYVALLTYKLNPSNTIGVNYTYLNQPSTRFSLQNLSAHAAGKLSGLGYKAAIDVQFGKTAENVKARGWDFLLGANYMMDPINIRGGFAYGSGDKSSTGDKQEAFQTFLGPDQHYTLVYDYQVATTAGKRFTGLSNTTYYNLGVDFTPVKDITASVDGYILRASKSAGSKNAGWEVDAKVAYKMAKNLTYQVDGGFFKTGKFYGDHREDATVLRHMITLSF